MQKDWYAIYTRPYCEKKVARTLSKKGFEVFLPLSYKKSFPLLMGNSQQETLFKSFIFIRTSEDKVLNLSKGIKGILSVLYWLGKPARIEENDINAIKEFIKNYKEIRLEKRDVNADDYESVIDDILLTIDGKTLTIKNKAIRVNLPSLGFTMVATIEENDIFGREMQPGRRDLVTNQ